VAHLWAIDPDAISQFSEDGKEAISQVSLDFACKSCHRTGGAATVKTDEPAKEYSYRVPRAVVASQRESK